MRGAPRSDDRRAIGSRTGRGWRVLTLCALAAALAGTGAAPGGGDPPSSVEPASEPPAPPSKSLWQTAREAIIGSAVEVSSARARPEPGVPSDSPSEPDAPAASAGPTEPAAPDQPTPPAKTAPNRPAAPVQDDDGGDDVTAEDDGGQVITVGLNDRVTMHVANLALADALRMLSEPAQRNIIMADGVAGTVTASMYDVSFEDALAAMLVSNGLGYRTKGKFIYVYSQEELTKMIAAERQLASRVFRLTYVNAAAVKGLIEPMLSAAGKASVTPPSKTGLGGETGPGDTEGDSLATPDTIIVTDYVDRLDAIEKVIRQLDERPRQVLIEATVLRATLHEDNALGIDFTTVGGIDFTTLNSVSPAAQDITTGNTPVGLLGDTTFTARTDLNAGLPAGGFTFGIIKDQIGLFIRALEQITDTSILANPKILALNKQVGQVIVGRRDGYFTTTTTETATVQTVEFLETGTILTFRPYISDDDFVRMEIHPKDSTGGLTDANLPFEQTTEVTTNILVRDGHTILVGGLFREVATATRGQVPALGNIPIAGALFRRTRDDTVREEVIILLTVRVIKGDPDTKASEDLTERIERFRVGMRRGLQWEGRERLSQAHYRWALQHLENGNLDQALWDTELALHNYSRHAHAAELREKLRGKRNWESEASEIRTYVRDRIAEDRGEVPSPAFGRPAPPFNLPPELQGPSGLEHDDAAAEEEIDRQDAAPPAEMEVRR